jgi:hypothetical protein
MISQSAIQNFAGAAAQMAANSQPRRLTGKIVASNPQNPAMHSLVQNFAGAAAKMLNSQTQNASPNNFGPSRPRHARKYAAMTAAFHAAHPNRFGGWREVGS